ncbi:hypothetical protein [Aureispira sp. CCB-QB1]|uniref:hypothetical protein n=1 Tax=Aureispira sp. CCB-QB1 TaxID=1313421 RepID=UPI000695E76A|nr:hypothetical protein [Aureispira sp. CCB-QB1]
MQNIGEEICGEYLNHIIGCDFITYNITNPDIHGEIDVVGIKLLDKEIYVCEVATHTGGLQYVTNKRPDDYNRFYSKFKKDIDYAQKYFKGFKIIPMLWSPIVRISNESAKYNTYTELIRLKEKIHEEYELNLKLIINEKYKSALDDLKNYASKKTSAFSSPVMRLFQIEKNLDKHIARLAKSKKN